VYTIGAFARLSQVPVRTLRYYDSIGLLRPAEVERGSGYRLYGAAQLEQLNRILVFKDLGLSLREIRRLLADGPSPAEIRAIIRAQREELERRVDRERGRLARAAARLDLMERETSTGSFEIAVRNTGAQLVATLRDTIPSYADCAGLLDELAHHTRGRGVRQRGAIWHVCAEGQVDCEVYEVIPVPVRTSKRVRVRELPAQRVASLVYRGDHDYLPAYGAMRAWLAATGTRLAGPKCEVFLDETEGDSATELQFPIAERAAGASTHRRTA
jgi:DNA-binding transcriptional MerR regulator